MAAMIADSTALFRYRGKPPCRFRVGGQPTDQTAPGARMCLFWASGMPQRSAVAGVGPGVSLIWSVILE